MWQRVFYNPAKEDFKGWVEEMYEKMKERLMKYLPVRIIKLLGWKKEEKEEKEG